MYQHPLIRSSRPVVGRIETDQFTDAMLNYIKEKSRQVLAPPSSYT